MHKFAYAEFVQDGGRQLKFRECYCDIPSQLYAVERQIKNTKLGIPWVNLINLANKNF